MNRMNTDSIDVDVFNICVLIMSFIMSEINCLIQKNLPLILEGKNNKNSIFHKHKVFGV